MPKQWKYERRAAKKKTEKRHTKVHSTTISHKDIYVVTGHIDTGDEFTLEVNANSYHGHPDEFLDIKDICERKLKSKVNILKIISK
jgi:hypothetical protein